MEPAPRRGRSTRVGVVLLAVFVALALLWRRAERTGDGGGQTGGRAHAVGKRGEHDALLALLPDAAFATHVAARDGAWSDAATWSANEVPGPGAIVLVPAGVTVRYDLASEAHLFLVRIDGTLEVRAPNGGDTRMVVDTLLTTRDSVLDIDATANGDGTIDLELRPFDIQAHEAAGAPLWPADAIEFYGDGERVVDTGADTRTVEELEEVDDGPGVLGRYLWDPKQLSLGLVAMGRARVNGRDVDAHVALARAARAGEDFVELKHAPAAWRVGDTLAVVGTRYVGRDLITGAYTGTEDELRCITSVNGARVELDRPLAFDHAAPREALDVPVANLTRNVRFRSAEPIDLERLDADAVGRTASRLGHVMFMHQSDVVVRGATFHNLGRTNKNDTLDDFVRRDYDGLDAPRAWDAEAGDHAAIEVAPYRVTNPRGRYSLHVHRAGANGDAPRARVEGCVATGGAGWGFVSHDSRADFVRNVTFGLLGAGFVAETGNETGTWEENLAINTYGAAFNNPRLEPKGLFRYENDDFEPTILLEKRGSWKNHDFGHCGDGFWLQGKLIDMRNNVSANSGLTGFYYMFRAPDQIAVLPASLTEPLSVHDPAGIHPFAPGLNVFRGNRSIGDRCGLIMIGLGGGRSNDERSVLQDFVAWEVGQVGTYAEYYPGYTIRDSSFLASDSRDAHPTEGVRFHKVQIDTVLADLEITGFDRAYDLRKSWSPGARNQQGFPDPYEEIRAAELESRPNPLPLGYAHVVINAGFDRAEASESHRMGPTYRAEDTLITSADLVPGRLEIELEDDSLRVDLDRQGIEYGSLPDDPVRPTLHEGHVLMLRGTKTDCIGPIPIDYLNNVLVWHAPAVQHRLETDGYYRMPSGALGVVLEEVFADRYTAEKKVVRFVAELDPRWDLARAVERGAWDPAAHADVYCPRFLLDETSAR